MNRQGHENVEFFLGPEVEHTPAHGKRTLFVVGYQEPEAVFQQAKDNRVTHVYLGANHSFDPELTTKGNAGKAWNALIVYLLDRGLFVTLDYQAHMHDLVLPMLSAGVWQSRLFIPMLAVRIPKIQTSSNNLTIKFDDIDFAATNEGVWCLNHHEVTDSNRFTPWQDYATDQTLSAIETTDARDSVTPMPPYIEPVKSTQNINLKDLKPAEAEAIKQVVVKATSPVLNETDTGLDPNGTSALKPETQEDAASNAPVVNTSPADAAEAYAAGAKEDPLGKEASTKGKSNKK